LAVASVRKREPDRAISRVVEFEAPRAPSVKIACNFAYEHAEKLGLGPRNC